MRIELRMARFVRAFLAVWVAAGSVLGGMLLYAVVAGWPSQGDTWVIFALPCFFLLAGYGLSRFSRSIARADREVLLQFIRRALDGTMEPDS